MFGKQCLLDYSCPLTQVGCPPSISHCGPAQCWLLVMPKFCIIKKLCFIHSANLGKILKRTHTGLVLQKSCRGSPHWTHKMGLWGTKCSIEEVIVNGRWQGVGQQKESASRVYISISGIIAGHNNIRICQRCQHS